MRLASDVPLAVELSDRETREHTVASQIKIGIPFQIRAIREKRGLTQEALAKEIGTTQNSISRLESPKTGKPTIKTLLRLARAFDVGLLVRFVPFKFYGDVIDAMDATHVSIPSYDEELRDELERNAQLRAVEGASKNLVQMPTQRTRTVPIVDTSDTTTLTVPDEQLSVSTGCQTPPSRKPVMSETIQEQDLATEGS